MVTIGDLFCRVVNLLKAQFIPIPILHLLQLPFSLLRMHNAHELYLYAMPSSQNHHEDGSLCSSPHFKVEGSILRSAECGVGLLLPMTFLVPPCSRLPQAQLRETRSKLLEPTDAVPEKSDDFGAMS